MDFKDQIKLLGERAIKLKESINTEEATKNAFIMPFIQSLGYDVFNPLEVVPEYISDIGTKKGEKIDYAILKDGHPIILVECKHWKENLDIHDGQLLRYFHVSKAKFGILTNGINYRFYTDLVETNKMDSKPFLEFNINDIKDGLIEEVKKFHKNYFEADKIIGTASDLKYINEIYNLLEAEFSNPSNDFVKYITGRVYEGRATEKVLQKFEDLIKKSINQVISDQISERLKTALKKEDEVGQSVNLNTIEEINNAKAVITTEEELEAYHIIKSILRKNIDPARLFYRDSVSYFSINLDDNNRKPICRLILKESKKYIIILDSQRNESKLELSSLNSIYDFEDKLISSTMSYFEVV